MVEACFSAGLFLLPLVIVCNMAIKHAQKEGKKFINTIPTAEGLEGGFSSVLKMTIKMIAGGADRKPKHQLGPFVTDTSVYNTPPANGLRVTWLGHSCLLLEIDGHRLLTDPVFGRASFAQWAGPKRFFPTPLPINKWPRLDAIIISHDHYDHLDETVIRKLTNSNTPFICSVGVGAQLQKWGIVASRISELNWSDSTQVKDLTITATPARHFSGRSLTNRNETLWSSFVIKGPKHNIFYGADSGMFPGFKDIGDMYGPFDLTMLEIGAYGEGWPDIHMGPDNAIQAHLALRGKQMMPIHWGTFNLAFHPWREPVERVVEGAKQYNITLFLPQPGLPTNANGSDVVSNWWQ